MDDIFNISAARYANATSREHEDYSYGPRTKLENENESLIESNMLEHAMLKANARKCDLPNEMLNNAEAMVAASTKLSVQLQQKEMRGRGSKTFRHETI